MSAGPRVWRASSETVEVRFVGRGGPAGREETLRLVDREGRSPAWLRQIHSDVCLEAGAGLCGEGDALWTGRPELALCVATADCVPVALAGAGGVALVHAGWRGIAAGVVARAVRAVAADAAGSRGWIGPAIGPCCYEVGDDVAARVEAASGLRAARRGAGERPHLDLAAAVEEQLQRAGVGSSERLGPCTRCSPRWLHSYRRDGAGAGRNLAFAWLRRGSI